MNIEQRTKDLQQCGLSAREAEAQARQEARHTPEPWHIGVRTAHSKRDIYGPQGSIVALADGVFTSLPEAQANARRIVACVNACAGIPLERLEREGATSLRDATAIKDQRDELAAALRRAADYITADEGASARAMRAVIAAVLAKLET